MPDADVPVKTFFLEPVRCVLQDGREVNMGNVKDLRVMQKYLDIRDANDLNLNEAEGARVVAIVNAAAGLETDAAVRVLEESMLRAVAKSAREKRGIPDPPTLNEVRKAARDFLAVLDGQGREALNGRDAWAARDALARLVGVPADPPGSLSGDAAASVASEERNGLPRAVAKACRDAAESGDSVADDYQNVARAILAEVDRRIASAIIADRMRGGKVSPASFNVNVTRPNVDVAEVIRKLSEGMIADSKDPAPSACTCVALDDKPCPACKGRTPQRADREALGRLAYEIEKKALDPGDTVGTEPWSVVTSYVREGYMRMGEVLYEKGYDAAFAKWQEATGRDSPTGASNHIATLKIKWRDAKSECDRDREELTAALARIGELERECADLKRLVEARTSQRDLSQRCADELERWTEGADLATLRSLVDSPPGTRIPSPGIIAATIVSLRQKCADLIKSANATAEERDDARQGVDRLLAQIDEAKRANMRRAIEDSLPRASARPFREIWNDSDRGWWSRTDLIGFDRAALESFVSDLVKARELRVYTSEGAEDLYEWTDDSDIPF